MDFLQLEKIYSKRKKNRKAFKFYLFLILASLFGLVYVIFFSALFKVNNITLNGLEVLNQERLQASINVFLKENQGGFIPFRNLFFIPKEKLSQFLKERYPIISEIEIKKNFPNSIILSVKEREPVFIVCPQNQKSTCFYIDKGGVAYQDAPKTEGSLISVIETEREFNQGDFLFEPLLIENLIEFKELLRIRLNLSTKKIITAKDVIFETYEGWQIRVAANTPFSERFEDLVLLLTSEIKEERKNLEYIDLTLPHRAYYKLKP